MGKPLISFFTIFTLQLLGSCFHDDCGGGGEFQRVEAIEVSAIHYRTRELIQEPIEYDSVVWNVDFIGEQHLSSNHNFGFSSLRACSFVPGNTVENFKLTSDKSYRNIRPGDNLKRILNRTQDNDFIYPDSFFQMTIEDEPIRAADHTFTFTYELDDGRILTSSVGPITILLNETSGRF